MFKLALRNIFRNRLRTALTLGAILAGVAAIMISGGFVEDVFVQLRESTIHSRLGHIQVYRQGYLEYGKREPSRYLIAEPQKLVGELRAMPHVREVMTRVNFSGLANNGRADLPIIGEGIEADKEGRLGTATTLVAGRQLANVDSYGVMVGEGVAAALQLKPNDYLTLMVNTPEGALNTLEFQVVGVFRTFSKEYDDRAVRIPMLAAQELLFTRTIHSVVVLLEDTALTDRVLSLARSKLGGAGYDVKAWYELADFYEKTVALYRRQFGALQVIILLMLVLSVASTVNMAVHERTGEFGTLQALGHRPRQVFRLIATEYLLLGLLGSLAGLLVGASLALAISAAGLPMPPPPGSNAGYVATIRLVPGVMVLAAITGWLAAVLAALLPARRAARLPIAESLRHNI